MGGGILGGALGATVGPVGTVIGALTGQQTGKKAGELLSPPDHPNLLAPNALSETPTQAQASKVAARRQLDQQRQSTSTVLNGGAGLLDEPTTTSRTLLGS